ncbi:endolysin [Psuedomonas phage SVOphi44]
MNGYIPPKAPGVPPAPPLPIDCQPKSPAPVFPTQSNVSNPQAFKADGGKPNWFLLMSAKGCAKALAGVVRVLSFAVRPVAEGGKGYTEHSWRLVPNAKERYEAALYRHLNAIHSGELVDPESGESHWSHIACNALFLSELHNSK